MPVRPRHAQRDEATARAAVVGVARAADEFALTYGQLYRWCRVDGVTPARGEWGGTRPACRQEFMHRDGTVDVSCWCEERVVRVDPADVRAGRTRSCGRAGCAAPVAA